MSILIRAIRFLYRKAGFNFHQKVRAEQEKKLETLSLSESNEYFKKIIDSGKPTMLSRLGGVETNCVLNYLEISEYFGANKLKTLNAQFKGKRSVWNIDVTLAVKNLAGVFPSTQEMLNKFSNLYLNEIKHIDGIGVWRFVPGESFLIKTYCPRAVRFDPEALDPYFFNSPWTFNLKGKKVLVIHPFSDSIVSQYQKRRFLFDNEMVLPEFELSTVKTVQSIAGNNTGYKDWFEALEYMKGQIKKRDFDIALISGGAYGLPLAAYVKSLGKCAIHMGGSLQILFGIKGKRWDDNPPTAALYNEHWIRPSETEKVKNAEIVEGSCYW